jgi:hypothetical protein
MELTRPDLALSDPALPTALGNGHLRGNTKKLFFSREACRVDLDQSRSLDA